MLLKTDDSGIRSAVRRVATSMRGISPDRAAEMRKFAAIVLQLGLLLALIRRFEIENPAFFQITVLTFVGFVVHYFLPLAYRLPFFAALSLASIGLVIGVSAASWLIGIGLALLGICHLGLPLWIRVTTLAAVGCFLAAMRGGWVPNHVPTAVWPILGSMFLFRMIVYLYDLDHGRRATSLSQSLAYFFMLPNICFPLYPIVDFQTFQTRYYNDDRFGIYQKGVHWIFRGIVHLLIYRIIYKNWGISIYDIENAGDLVHYCVWSFLLYLRVSGEFHVIVGILHLFGFNLPETHHLYYLATSFLDFWRRINIYWKDFMMKVFFYPCYFRARKLGPQKSLVLTTLVVFLVTWSFHSLQWFWLRGSFLLSGHDMFFWAILAGLVVVNSLWELKHPRKRLGQATWGRAVLIGLKTLATFTAICLLWSMWTSESLAVWLNLWKFARVPPTLSGWLTICGIVIAIFGGGILLARGGLQWNLSFTQETLVRCSTICVLLVLSLGIVRRNLGDAGELIASARSAGLNREDQMDLEQGYYEGLLAIDKFNPELADSYARMPRQWSETIVDAGLATPTGDFQRFELKPSVQGMFKGAMLRTNQWGMHDKEYALQAPAGTYRIAMLGASISMGTGVEQEQTFEALVEDRLNRDNVGGAIQKYEILNFSVWAYRAVQQIKVLEQKVIPFKPDAIFYVEHAGDRRRLIVNLAEAISQGIPAPFPFLEQIYAEAKVDSTVPQPIIRRRLQPFTMQIFSRVYERIISTCRRHNIKPVFVSLPPLNPEKEPPNTDWARAAGFEIVDLKGLYDGRIWWNLCLSQWDAHPTPEGHRIIADRLYKEIQKTKVIPLGTETPTER